MTRPLMALVALVALVAAACSGGDPLRRYFEDVDEVTSDLAAAIETLPRASTAGTLDDARAYFAGIDEALGDAVSAFEAMSVPENMSGVHESFLATVAEYAAVASGAAIRGESLESRDDLLAMANDAEVGVAAFREAREAVLDACVLLLVTAAAPEIGVEMDCTAFTADGGSAASARVPPVAALAP